MFNNLRRQAHPFSIILVLFSVVACSSITEPKDIANLMPNEQACGRKLMMQFNTDERGARDSLTRLYSVGSEAGLNQSEILELCLKFTGQLPYIEWQQK